MAANCALDTQVATVWTTPEGAPARFVWSGRRFVVCAKPILWIARMPWWETSTRPPTGSNTTMVECAMWQVQAKALDDGQLLIFDLAATEQAQWPVTAIFD